MPAIVNVIPSWKINYDAILLGFFGMAYTALIGLNKRRCGTDWQAGWDVYI